jgi:WD40 repeat protein
VRIWDAVSGKLLQRRPLADRPYRTRWEIRTARSADGKTLLIGSKGTLQMWDLPSGKRLDLPLPTGCKRLDCISVLDDRRFLLLVDTVKEQFVQQGGGGFGFALEMEQHILLWDTTTGKQRCLAKDEKSLVSLAMSPDGKRLASSSYGKGTCVYETATGKLLWREAKFNAERMRFTPDSRHLIAAPGGGQSAWHVWDAATGRPAKSFPAPAIGYVWTFTLSPDGNKLLAPTGTDYVLWDLQAGKVLHRWPGAQQRGKVAFAPDGRSVVTCDAVVRRWDIASGKGLYDDVSLLGHVASVRRLFFTPDGKRLASVGEDDTIRIWNLSDTQLLHTIDLGPANRPIWDWSSDGGTTNRDGWTLTPDGATLIGVDGHLTVHRWSVADGRPLPSFALDDARQLDIRLRALHVRVSPDGKTLIASAWPQCPEYRFSRFSFSFWDLPGGLLRTWGGDPGRDYRGDFAELSADGRFAARDGSIFDTRTGKHRLLLNGAGVRHVFSADGRLLAAMVNGVGVRVCELATGRRLLDLPEAGTHEAALTSDGRRFAFTTQTQLVIHDLVTGQILCKREAPKSPRRDGWWTSAHVVFSPDGRTVATGHPDGTILLWNVPSGRTRGRLTERETAVLWDDLASEGPAKAYAAVWRFRDDPSAAARYLRKSLPPVARPADGEWRALIQQLDSERFAEREAASRRLKAAGAVAGPALRQAQRGKLTPEQKRRIKDLLAPLDAAAETLPQRLSREDLRVIRAVAVLEGSNTEEARRVLAEWAKGAPEACLTEEAAQALTRLKWQPVVSP